MKNHTTYTKSEPPYFNLSEFLFFPVLPIAIVLVVSYAVLYLLGVTSLLVADVVIALIASYIYIGLKNATPNGGSGRGRSESDLLLSLLPSFLLLLCIEIFLNVGVYIVVKYQKNGVFHAGYFYAWLFVIVGLPVLYLLARQLQYLRVVRAQAIRFRPLRIKVTTDSELELYIKEIAFVNIHTKTEGTIFNQYSYAQTDRTLAERNEDLNASVFSETIYIPTDTNLLRISWYSALEDKFYKGEAEFPFSTLGYEENKYPLNESRLMRGEKAKPVTLSIREEGRIQLYNQAGDIISPLHFHGSKPTEEDVNGPEDFATYQRYVRKELSQLEVKNILQQIRRRTNILDFVCNWQITGSGLKGYTLYVTTIKEYTTIKAEEAISTRSSLPIKIAFSYERYTWATVYLDAQQLYDLIQLNNLNESELHLEAYLDIEKGSVSLSVKIDDKSTPFKGTETEIQPESQEVVKKKIQEARIQEAKNKFCTQVYELMQQQKYEEAQTLSDRALAEFPDLAFMYFYQARLLWYTQGYEASYAQENYFIEKTQQDSLALSRIYNHYGCLFDAEKRYPESLSSFEKAAETHPQETMYLANIAEIHYKMKNMKQALHYAEQCMSKDYTSDMIKEIVGAGK